MRDDLPTMADVPDVPDEEDEGEAGTASGDRGSGGAGLPASLMGLLSPVVGRVPEEVLSAVAAGLVVILGVILVVSLAGGRSAAADLSPDAAHPPPELAEHRDSEGAHEPPSTVVPTPGPPTSTPTPTGPTPTPTPILWEERDGAWIGHGMPGPSRFDLLQPERFLFLEETLEDFTMTVRFNVLVASGTHGPQWGVALAYHDPQNMLFLESFTEERRPYFQLSWAKDGAGGPVGERLGAPGISFWGRDTHELKVQVVGGDVTAWLNDLPLGQWPNPGVTSGGRKGLVVWFHSKVRFDAVTFE